MKKATRELKECHKAFARHIEDSYTPLDCFTEHTLNRDENGSYTNMSVSMEWPIFRRAWHAGRAFENEEMHAMLELRKPNHGTRPSKKKDRN